ncbi:hypothetical protein EDD21DRAFT_406992 [Dissophora ornata]|nr:hypothetical protein EDD21DRAFT_406992 [Dissophora ornata]
MARPMQRGFNRDSDNGEEPVTNVAAYEFDANASGSESDSSYDPDNASAGESDTEEDTTEDKGFEDAIVDRLVGPGQCSSKFFREHWVVDTHNVSAPLMVIRKEAAKDQAKLCASHDILLLNFVFTPTILQMCLPPHIVHSLLPPLCSPVPDWFQDFCYMSSELPLSTLVSKFQLNSTILSRHINMQLISGQLLSGIRYSGSAKETKTPSRRTL